MALLRLAEPWLLSLTDLFWLTIHVPDFDLQFNLFLARDAEPLLFHAWLKGIFPALRDAVAWRRATCSASAGTASPPLAGVIQEGFAGAWTAVVGCIQNGYRPPLATTLPCRRESRSGETALARGPHAPQSG